jgi:hypothetical protein
VAKNYLPTECKRPLQRMDQHTEPAGVNEVERGDVERDQPATTPVEPGQAGENREHRDEVKLTLSIARGQ